MKYHKKQINIFLSHGGLLRTKEAFKLGIHPEYLYAMKKDRVIVPVSRGLYRLSELTPLSNPPFVAIATKVPRGIIAMKSALYYHRIINRPPSYHSVILPFGAKQPRLREYRVQYFWESDKSYNYGIEYHNVDGVKVKICCIEKAVIDLFKFRSKLGMLDAISVLKKYFHSKKYDRKKLLKYSSICRMNRIIIPLINEMERHSSYRNKNRDK